MGSSLEWRRHSTEAAHLWLDGRSDCRYVATGSVPVNPQPLRGEELTCHGQPFGRICSRCQSRFEAERQGVK